MIKKKPATKTPTIPAINIPFHQRMDTLTEGIIDRNRGTLSGQDGRINRRGRQAGKTHQHEEESHIRMDGKNKRHNTIPKIQAINIEIYQWKVTLTEGSIDINVELTQHV